MRHRLTDRQHRELDEAVLTIKAMIGVEYPEDGQPDGPEPIFRWGVGDGFRLALDAVVEAALPRWRDHGHVGGEGSGRVGR